MVRLFAAAAEAVGANELTTSTGSVASLREELAGRGAEAPRVIAQCALLRAGERLSDEAALAPGDLVDVLPPFAGG
ncbi:MoaD/ThiS family protein [Demequina mangrovi]|uniref:Molybdopterin converting factor, small subunit n=1 Tax=Demequina mangrovi TaxID=1043493 RepID=A0A1H6UZE4_9MICO|nr:MoaD/ThiS family protein [Demequina mangrovi]SEI96976.1 Molybdopterin converting factor, small subunit [Demequina mangrovi]